MRETNLANTKTVATTSVVVVTTNTVGPRSGKEPVADMASRLVGLNAICRYSHTIHRA